MRNSGVPSASIFRPSTTSAAGEPAALQVPLDVSLLVGFRLAHDFLRREIDAAGREGVADEEIVRLVGIIVLAFLEVRVLDDGERQLDGLRHDLTLERRDRGLYGDGDLRRPGA